MPSERIQRRIDLLLDEADGAVSADDWALVTSKARAVLAIDEGNEDAIAFLRMADANLSGVNVSAGVRAPAPDTALASPTVPSSFVAGRYAVRRFLGEGGKKRVFLAHDERLDRDVAFALIKTDGLDEVGRERITREAQAMGRLGAHPHVVTIFEIGEEAGAPYVVTELLGGGDVEGALKSEGGALPLARTLEIAKGVARGLAFAHQQGVVHRDLKPGNVWLTSEGVAKIGDFGLAVALDRSRLTTHGLMVGTVAYMPPEQALGGEVTPQADLYSLGAMLYELVTGKPPFAGDSPTAIISQHINTPPVAPSWHSEHCPPDLEALILHLLAKVPADRPASALEVLTALERVDPEARSASHSDSSANPLDRLARGVFVGRERELERLRAAFDDAFAGRGSVVMLVGEPGIGKTRTSLELETYARMRGAKVLWGRANESSGAPPYFPWTQLGRAYAAATDDATLTNQLRDYAVELQRLFPGVRNRFPGLPEPPPVEDESAQFRLFDAMSGFYRDVAEQTPLVLVLDDLHWADRPTLALLTHLARELIRARILVLGTYRDTDLDRQHPLSRTLADLNREQLFTRINLRGLTRDEVGEYIRATAQVEPTARLVDRVHEETEGNAFFLSEVVNLMAQEGSFEKTSVSDVAIPEGVKEALGRRLDRLSSEANELLSLAAVLGRDFDHAQLVAVSGRADDEVLRLVDEALAARVLEETGAVGGYRFTHALMQETLLGELSAARRVRLHGQIAEALDALYGDTADSRAPELARHYLESSALNREHARAAARYSRVAAEQAAKQFAWADAIRHYEQCLARVAEAPDHLGEDEAALWLALARVQLPAGGRLVDGWHSFERAIAIYRERNDRQGEARAWGVSATLPGGPEGWYARIALLDSALPIFRGGGSSELCTLLALRAFADLEPTGDAFAAEAEAMAAQLGLSGTAYPWQIPRRAQFVALDRGHFEESLELGPRLHDRMVAAGAPAHAPLILAFFAAAFLGDLTRSKAMLDAALAQARRQRDRQLESNALTLAARIAWQSGDRVRYAEALDQAMPGHFNVAMLEAEVALVEGEAATALRLSPSADRTDLFGVASIRANGLRTRIFLALHDAVAARREFEAWVSGWRSMPSQFVVRSLVLASLSEAAHELGDRALRGELCKFLGRYPNVRSNQSAASSDHLLGLLAFSLDRSDEAEHHFRTGLEWALQPEVRFEVDAGRNLQGLAEIAERRGDVDGARTHLDAAGALFAKHGARLYLDQVLAKKQLLGA